MQEAVAQPATDKVTGQSAEKVAAVAEVLVTVLVRQLIMVVVVVAQAHRIQAATAIKAL
jgi:hypothetical protein